MENGLVVLQKTKNRSTLWSSNPITGHIPGQNWNSKHMQRNVHWSTISLSYLVIQSQSVTSVAQLCPTLCDPMNCSTPGLPVHHQLLEFTETQIKVMSIESVMPSSHLILCHPLLLLPPIPPSIRVFFNEVQNYKSTMPQLKKCKNYFAAHGNIIITLYKL